jgi:hypothetical protein
MTRSPSVISFSAIILVIAAASASAQLDVQSQMLVGAQ